MSAAQSKQRRLYRRPVSPAWKHCLSRAIRKMQLLMREQVIHHKMFATSGADNHHESQFLTDQTHWCVAILTEMARLRAPNADETVPGDCQEELPFLGRRKVFSGHRTDGIKPISMGRRRDLQDAVFVSW